MAGRVVAVALLLCAAPAAADAGHGERAPSIEASGLRITLSARPGALWSFDPASAAPDHHFAPPVFPLDGRLVTALPEHLSPIKLVHQLDATGAKWLRANDPENWAKIAPAITVKPAKTAVEVK